MNEITTKVLNILARHARPKPDQVSFDTCLESLGIDSLGMMEILFSLEDEFHISIPQANDIEQRSRAFATAADVVRLVESLLEPAIGPK